jgi:hypothetical protein
MSINLVGNKVKIHENKKIATAALILLLTTSAFMVCISFTSAHDPAWNIPTYAYLAVSPNPVGVNQYAYLVFWIDKQPPTAAGSGGDRWTSYTIEVTNPNGTTKKLGTFTSAAESTAYTSYKPTQVGTYTFLFKFGGQILSRNNPVNGQPGSNSAMVGDYFMPSNATATLTVQADSVNPVESYPLPTSYWTRPIEGQNTAWDAIASNYLGSPQIVSLVQPNGAGPSTSHVMWTKQFGAGGVVGGSYGAPGMTFYGYDSYEAQFQRALIMNGNLYYTPPRSTGSASYYTCVDLRTGEDLFSVSGSMPTFGQLYDYESMNQHGVIPNGYMWRTSGTTWMAFDPADGSNLFNLTGVPSGTNAYGPNGEILVYQLNTAGKWLALWNNTAAYRETSASSATDTSTNAYQWRPVGKSIDASLAYSWNVTVPTLTGASVLKVIYNDMMLLTARFPSTFWMGGNIGTPDNCQVWAVSLKPESRGTLLWTKNYTAPEGNITRAIGPVDPDNRVFTMFDKETMQYSGYSIDTGDYMWGPVGNALAFQYFGYGTLPSESNSGVGHNIYMGHLYQHGWGGLIYCYDTKTGELLWTYGNGGEGNNTNSGLDTPWGYYPNFVCAFADGKVYLYSTEHSPNTPPYKGEKVRCIDANTGKELWTLMGWSCSAFIIADGYGVYLNTYDNQLYSVGKGPSATTVTAAPGVGNIVTIQGTVTDVSAGAKQLMQTGEFNVVPAISDESMGKWMEYIYMQKPIPTNATGVPVTLYVSDTSGVVDTLQATTDLSGHYIASWTPTTTGTFTVTASFEGTNGYYGSTDVNGIAVGTLPATSTPTPTAAPTTAAPTTTAPTETAAPTTTAPEPKGGIDTYVYVSIAAVVVIVAIAALAMILRRRK